MVELVYCLLLVYWFVIIVCFYVYVKFWGHRFCLLDIYVLVCKLIYCIF